MKKKTAAFVSAVALCLAVVVILVTSKEDAPISIPDPAVERAAEPESPIAVGFIETKDGQTLDIQMAPGTSNNFGIMPRSKGEMVSMSVSSDQERALVVGIMSVSTEEIYSERLETGTGTITVTVPEDGDYRIYVSNDAIVAAHFQLKLDRALEGPIV